MKIAIMIDSLAVGGAQKHVRQLACGLASSGFTVTVYVLNEIVSPVYLDPMRSAGVRVVVVGRRKVLSGLGLAKVVADLWESKCTLLLTVLFVSTIFGRIAALGVPGVRVVTCLQARNVNYRGWQKALVRFTAGLAFWTISNSRAALAWAQDEEGIDLRRSSFLPNAVEAPVLSEPEPTWTALGFPQLENRLVVGSIGRLDPQKGFDLLIEAFAAVRTEIPEVALLIIGEGRARESLQQSCRDWGCEAVVIFAGERTDARRFLRKFAIYAQPSRFEGTPNALMEAMAAGCPVVATGVDGVAEIVVDSLSGRLVAPNDVPALLEALLILLADREAACALGRAGQRVMATAYSPERLQTGFSSILDALSGVEVCG